MSSTTSSSPTRVLSVFVGTLAAFASFALLTSLIQGFAGGKPGDPLSKDRIAKRTAAVAEQKALIEKYGLSTNADAIFEKSASQLQTRKEAASTVVVPGTPTALKQAAPAAPAAAPASPAPAPAVPTNPK
jgi:hypothetical protein